MDLKLTLETEREKCVRKNIQVVQSAGKESFGVKHLQQSYSRQEIMKSSWWGSLKKTRIPVTQEAQDQKGTRNEFMSVPSKEVRL